MTYRVMDQACPDDCASLGDQGRSGSCRCIVLDESLHGAKGATKRLKSCPKGWTEGFPDDKPNKVHLAREFTEQEKIDVGLAQAPAGQAEP